MVDLIRTALDVAGYGHEEATEENLIECFKDYVDAGYWWNLDLEEGIEGISIKEMCIALIG